jgi:CBS domain containing-hemolysin-like protein
MSEIAGGLSFLGVLILYSVLAAANSALINSHPTQLQKQLEKGRLGASLAVRVASDATQLILSMRLGKGLLRLLAIGFVVLGFSSRFVQEGMILWIPLASLLLISGVLIGLVGLFAENAILSDPERWALRLTPVAYAVIFILTPATWLVLRLAGRSARTKEGRLHPLVTEEEIMTMVDAGEEGGVIEEEEKAMIYSIFKLGDTLAREVMIPRIDIRAFEENSTLLETANAMLQYGYSRAPVFSESIDNIVGLVYLKDLLAAWLQDRQDQPIAKYLREANFIPEAKKVDDLLAAMQAKQVHMAIVVDEYGGTAGLVTIEDIVEEIVGEIRDEYDINEEESFQVLKEGEFLFSGGIDLDDVNQIAESELPKETSETLAGFIYGQLGRVPFHGDRVEAGGLELVVEQVAGRRIRKVRATRVEKPLETELDENQKETT